MNVTFTSKLVRFSQLAAIAIALMSVGYANQAQACQLVCMKTNTTYNGNLGGLAGADAKCAAEFPGFKFARSYTIVANIPGITTQEGIYMMYNSWMHGTSNCANWTSSDTADNGFSGTAYGVQSGPYIWPTTFGCNAGLPLICCNM